jgi:hypothetical protein
LTCRKIDFGRLAAIGSVLREKLCGIAPWRGDRVMRTGQLPADEHANYKAS